MIKISVVIITFNEEKNIERCLNSVKDIADEIVVLDSFSTDKTEEICKKHNVKFFQHKFDGYTQQKNRAVNLAVNNYILSLDADEELSAKLKNSIKEIKNNPIFEVYKFNRLNIYCGKAVKHTSWYPDCKIRFWNKEKGRWVGDKIHEIVEADKDCKIGFLKGDLLHYSYNSIEEHISQTNKFSTLGAEQISGKSFPILLFKALFNPVFRFFKNYFIKHGFLGGYTSFMISVIISFETFLKYSKAIFLYKKKS